MEQKVLEKKLAQLEGENDQLFSELCSIDQLMRSVGFTHGLETIKGAAEEILKSGMLESGGCSKEWFMEN